MKKSFIITALTALTLTGLSPVLLAGPHGRSARASTPTFKSTARPTTLPARSFNKPATFKPTHHRPQTRPLVYKPTTRPGTTAFKPVVHHGARRPVGVLRPVKFRGGVFYSGKAHYHWTKRSYNAKWRQWFFFDPRTRGWYFWYARGFRYYPVACIAEFPPTQAVLPAPGEPGNPGSEAAPLADVPEVSPGEEPEVPEQE
jgi:hypothetical protein